VTDPHRATRSHTCVLLVFAVYTEGFWVVSERRGHARWPTRLHPLGSRSHSRRQQRCVALPQTRCSRTTRALGISLNHGMPINLSPCECDAQAQLTHTHCISLNSMHTNIAPCECGQQQEAALLWTHVQPLIHGQSRVALHVRHDLHHLTHASQD
jgi:hypothetical protein